MTITLQEGKFYVDRCGAKWGPMHRLEDDLPYEWSTPAGNPTWLSDGRYNINENDTPYDLMEEWVESADEPCPAQIAVEGVGFADATEILADVKSNLFAPPACPSCGSTTDFHWSHCTAIVSHSDPVPEPFTHGDSFEGMSAFPPSVMADIKTEIADTAKRIVSGARRAAYGKPEDNFERIARFWQSYFENTGRASAQITAADVSPMMRLMKEARLCETPDHKDSFVDLVGYALTGAEVNKVQVDA